MYGMISKTTMKLVIKSVAVACLLSIILITFSSCAIMPGWIIGSGKVITEPRDVKYFDRVTLKGSGNLIIEQGDVESLKIEAEDNIIPTITTEVQRTNLVIGYEWRFLSGRIPTKPINFYLKVKDIRAITLSGSGTVKSGSLRSEQIDINISGSGKADLNVDVKEINTRISGSGSVKVIGETEKQEIVISGSGSYPASGLASKECKIVISGSGNCNVRVSDDLDVHISGSGNVFYVGNPMINQDISGSGKINNYSD